MRNLSALAEMHLQQAVYYEGAARRSLFYDGEEGELLAEELFATSNRIFAAALELERRCFSNGPDSA